MSLLSRLVLTASGWSINEKDWLRFLHAYSQFDYQVWIYPHTSIWDGILGGLMGFGYLPHVPITFLVSETVYRRFSWILSSFRVIPVNMKRNKRGRLIDQIINYTKHHPQEKLVIALSPEGGRERCAPEQFRTGYFTLASQLQQQFPQKRVGIGMMAMNYETHTFHIDRLRPVSELSDHSSFLTRYMLPFFQQHPQLYPSHTEYGSHSEKQTHVSLLSPFFLRCVCLLLSILHVWIQWRQTHLNKFACKH